MIYGTGVPIKAAHNIVIKFFTKEREEGFILDKGVTATTNDKQGAFVPVLTIIIGCFGYLFAARSCACLQGVIGFINGFFCPCAGTIAVIIICGTLYCLNGYFCSFASDTSAGSTTTAAIVTMVEGDENIFASASTPNITAIENTVNGKLEIPRGVFRTTIGA